MRKIPLSVVVALVLLAAWPGRVAAQLTDLQLGQRVAATIRSYAGYTMFDEISLVVTNRVVTVTGRVVEQITRDEILRRVAKIEGVLSVTNQVRVLPFSAMDQSLRRRIAENVYSHPAFWQYAQMTRPPIHIIVENSRVTLTGVVNSDVERKLADSRARLVDGTLSVTNELQLDSNSTGSGPPGRPGPR